MTSNVVSRRVPSSDSLTNVDRFRNDAEIIVYIFGGTRVFPLMIRQRVKLATFLSLALSMAFWSPPLLAQDDPDDDDPVVENLPVDNWAPPDWYMDQDEAKLFGRQILRFTGLKSNNPNRQQVAELKQIAQYWLSQLAYPENRSELPKKVSQRFVSALLGAGTRAGGRAVLMDEMLKLAPELKSHPSEQVWVNVILLVVQMSIEPSDFSTQAPAVPYNPAHKFLLDVVQDDEEILEARVAAAAGLIRFCRDGKNAPSSKERSDLAVALTKTLSANPPAPSEDGITWFRQRLLEVLGHVGRADDLAGNPIVLTALFETMREKKETWENRAIACHSLSQIPLPGGTNLELIVHEVCKFLKAMLENKQFQKAPNNNLWMRTFTRVYLSFRPKDQAAADEGFGWMAKAGAGNRQYVTEAFKASLPILSAVLTNTAGPPPINQKMVNDLDGWIGTNAPQNKKLLPNLAELKD